MLSKVKFQDKIERLAGESGRVGYLVLWLLGAPFSLLFVLWLILGDNLLARG
jgi:hypothetical protein